MSARGEVRKIQPLVGDFHLPNAKDFSPPSIARIRPLPELHPHIVDRNLLCEDLPIPKLATRYAGGKEVYKMNARPQGAAS